MTDINTRIADVARLDVDPLLFCSVCKVDTRTLGGGVWESWRNDVITARTCNPCRTGEKFAQYAIDKRLSSSLTMDAGLIALDIEMYQEGDYPEESMRRIAKRISETKPAMREAALEIKRGLDALKVYVKQFEREVWFGGGLQTKVCKSNSGLSAKYKTRGDIETTLMILCSAGRCLLTIEDENDSVTLITAEDEGPNHKMRGVEPDGQDPMGVQGISTTAQTACFLVASTIVAWRDGQIKLKTDRKISFG